MNVKPNNLRFGNNDIKVPKQNSQILLRSPTLGGGGGGGGGGEEGRTLVYQYLHYLRAVNFSKNISNKPCQFTLIFYILYTVLCRTKARFFAYS